LIFTGLKKTLSLQKVLQTSSSGMLTIKDTVIVKNFAQISAYFFKAFILISDFY